MSLGTRFKRWLAGADAYRSRSQLMEHLENRDFLSPTNARRMLDAPGKFTGLSSLNATLSTGFKWVAQNNLTGSAYNPITNVGNIALNGNFQSTIGNTTTGGADQIFSFQQSISAGSSATIDLSAMTNILAQAAVAIARIKGYQLRLLSATNDPTISPAPVGTSIAVISNNGPATPVQLDFGAAGTGLTIAFTVSTGVMTGPSIGAAGTGYPKSATFIVTVNQAGGSGAVVSVTTNSSGVPTAVALVTGGTGYTAATVGTTVLGQYQLNTGGAHMYFDPLANGFCAIDSTHKNVKIFNTDGSNPITIEVDVIGCST